MGNVLEKAKQEQVIALGRLGWSLRRIEAATGVRRETAGGYLRSAGIALRMPGGWGRKPPAKAATSVTAGSDSGEHYSAKLVGYFMLTAALKMEQPEVLMYKHFGETVEAIWASRLAGNRVPIFWLTRELTEALKLTKLPVALDFTTMKLPFEAAVFMLPKGSLTYQEETADVVCVSYARTAMREEIPSITPLLLRP